MKNLIFTLLLTMMTLCGRSQDCRFLDELFPDVQRTDDIAYGVNATLLYFPVFGEAIPETLLFDIYEPVGDTSTQRPLVIYFHSGNFLPFPQNQSPVGTKKDSSAVEFCKRLARAGYVVASADYRLGWNPLATNPIEGTIGIINAAYRGVQDANTCIRYFKKSFVEEGNPYQIDTCRIVLFGDDTGGYLSVHAGALDRYSKIPESPQFNVLLGGSFYPMIMEYLNGDVEGKQYGVNTPPYPLFPYPAGDTLNYPNHVDYSSRFCAAVNLGGAVAESWWIEPGQPPIISIGTKYDLTTPYDSGIVYVGGNPIIYVYGPKGITDQSTMVGNISSSIITPDKYCSDLEQSVTAIANLRNDGLEGLLPIIGNSLTDFNPWIFCDLAEPNCASYAQNFNPVMSRENASLYIDSILAYVKPRLYKVLNLENPGESCVVTSTDRSAARDFNIQLFPNPSTDEVTIQSGDNNIIVRIDVYDSTGKHLYRQAGTQSNTQVIPASGFLPGLYTVRIQFEDGIAARQMIIK